MQLKKLTTIVICCFILSLPSYSFAYKATTNNITDIESIHPGTNDKIGNMLLQSVSLIGIPYKWGGNTPGTGLDCSGFIRYIFQKSLGITLPRTANEMADLGRAIPLNQLEPGD
ncbi:MAG TPA: C40 family peptidase, partial [Aquella sp.]|nr:C40 family peptidase [Aquella sp.]